jgi:prophage regulatory protein
MSQKIRETLLRRKQVEARTGLTRSTIYALIARQQFPKPLPLVGRTVAWRETSIDAWIANKIASVNDTKSGVDL